MGLTGAGRAARSAALALAVLGACRPEEREARPDRGPEPEVAPAPATLRRLTRAQYGASLDDVFGPGLVLPALEPDVAVEGLVSVGAGQAALSPYGVEQFETAAFQVAAQVLGDPDRRARVLACDPDANAPADRRCAETFVREVGRRLWRRSLADAEVADLADLAEEAAVALAEAGDVEAPGREGLSYALAALLQAPDFLYRVELAEAGRFSGPALASRMAFLLWGGPPDDALLDLAESGGLADPEDRRAEAARMLADPRAERGVRALFDELLGLGELEALTKDGAVFVHWSDTLPDSAREETLALVETIWREDRDLRELLTADFTFLDPELAALYGVRAPTREGFGRVDLGGAPGGRRGLLGQASFLALRAHPVSTSVTRRGAFVRERLLCHDIPPPPANVDTSIPEASGETPTMRDRVAEHLENPVCATCHERTDPLGLALEHFDGVGRWRADDGGYAIDATGTLALPDDELELVFDGLDGLASALAAHPDYPRCVATQVLRVTQGHLLAESEEELVGWLDAGVRAPPRGEPVGALGLLLREVVGAEGFALAEAGEP